MARRATLTLPPVIRRAIEHNPNGFNLYGPRYWTGVVLHTKMTKTAMVLVRRRRRHPIYGKFMLRDKKYMVHDQWEEAGEGDKILFEKSRPHSKRKHWEVRAIVAKEVGADVLEQTPELQKSNQERKEEERERKAQELAAKGTRL